MKERWVVARRGLPSDYICGPAGPAAIVGDWQCCGHSNLSHVYTDCPACEMEVAVLDWENEWADRVLQVATVGPDDVLVIGLSGALTPEEARRGEEQLTARGLKRFIIIAAPEVSLAVQKIEED